MTHRFQHVVVDSGDGAAPAAPAGPGTAGILPLNVGIEYILR